MEKLTALMPLVLPALLLVRLFLIPIRPMIKLLVHSGCGFLCLWLLNTISSFTGVSIPVNMVTVLIAGVLGLPGIALVVLLEVLP